MRRPVAKVREEALLAFGFGAQLKNALFPEQIHGEFGGDDVGELLVRVGSSNVARVVAEDQRMASLIEFGEGFACLLGWSGVAIIEVVNAAFEERVYREEFDDTEGSAADREDVHAAVVVTFNDFQNFGGAAGAGNSVREGEKHAEFGLVVEAIADHFAVARLENVQRKVSAGKKNDVQRKQRNAIRPHGFVQEDSSRRG